MHLARRFLVPSPVSYALKSSTLFVLTKHVNGVALNTRVVNHNFRNALTLHYNFWGYFTSSSNFYELLWKKKVSSRPSPAAANFFQAELAAANFFQADSTIHVND